MDRVIQEIDKKAKKKYATQAAIFFKEKKDVFLGVKVPDIRKIAHKYSDLVTLGDIRKLLRSNVHEHKYVGLEILVYKYKKGDAKSKQEIVKFYIDNKNSIDNWDLVDTSAYKILGEHLLASNDEDVALETLGDMAKSQNKWERRIAVVSTFAFIRKGILKPTLFLAGALLHDEEDYIHKAVGWMLREVGKKDVAILEQFLDKHAKMMPRTMLRYAIERFPQEKRKKFLAK